MRHLFSTSALAVLAFACSATAVVAQETTSSIRGSVSGPSGPVVGANVEVTHVPSGTTQTITTTGAGTFVASGLRPGGPYSVTVTADGLSTGSYADISLTVGQPYNMPIVLDEATAVDELVITARRPEEPLSTTFDRENIEGVASVARDIRDIARRDPFASFNPSSRGVSIAGTNARTNRFSVDGVRFSDNFGLANGGLPTTRGPVPLDGIQQLSVKVAPYDISEGDFQGGAINVVLRSGDNDYTGSVFYTYNSDDLMGDESRGTPVTLDLTSKNFGGFVSGPLIKDKLFFAASYENLNEVVPATFGLAGSPSVVPGLTQATLDTVEGIAQNVYNYDPQGLLTSRPESDKKYTFKLDWNVTDMHRASYTYIHNEGQTIAYGGGSNSVTSPSLGYASYATYEPEEVDSHVVQFNSSWTSAFSTEVRLNWRQVEKFPSSYGEAGFSQFQVCTDNVSVGSFLTCTQGNAANPGPTRLFMGVEQFSQADEVGQEQYGAELIARYIVGDHVLKATAQASQVKIHNVFVHSSLGLYTFDSITDFQNRRASILSWQNSITGDLDDLSASFDYEQYIFGLQDSWDITPDINLLIGARWDLYKMKDRSPLNSFFVNRYGFANNFNLDGNIVAQPRAQLTWRATDDLTLRAGIGLFSGGAPDVFIGNSFSVAGRYGNTITIQRDAASPTGCTSSSIPASVPLADAIAICNAALTNVTGRGMNPLVVNFLQTNTAAISAAPVNAQTDDFQLPSVWKFSVSADYDLPPLGWAGDNWSIGGDLYYGKTKNAAIYTDLRLTQVDTAPDGRPIYADTYTNSNNNDLLMSNTGRGHQFVAVARAHKIWDFGLVGDFSYTYSDIKSLGDMNGSTASGTYGAQPMIDPNFPAYGTSEYEIKHNIKASLDYAYNFFGDNETRFSLFGEFRSGAPYSLTMNVQTTRNVFGVTGSNNRFLLYVPNVSAINADPAVTYNSVATYEAFRDFVVGRGLPQGKIIGKNSEMAPDYFKVDLHIEQEFPAPYVPEARFKLFADIENILNMIDDEYGAYRTVSLLSPVVNVSCNAGCSQYTYSSFAKPTVVNNARLGLWSVRLGAKFEF